MDEVIDAEAVEIIEGDPPALMPRSDVAVRETTAMVAQGELTVDDLIAQHDKIVAAMQGAMKEGVHYGLIPGVNKPSLFKPGAESLVVLFRLAPHYESEKIWHDDGHLTVITTARLEHIPTGLTVATGEGLCTTRESRYAWRKGERVCPDCGEPQVRLGKARDGRPGNWYCWQKFGGCGATWALDSEEAKLFEAMETGRVQNPDLSDTYNVVLKMANKRALVAAVLNGTAASDVFTQDVEDMKHESAEAVFDPEKDLLPGAIRGTGAARSIADGLAHMCPHVDIGATLGLLAIDAYDVAGAKDLKGDVRVDWMRRLSNATAKLGEIAPGDFPPASDDQIREAFAFAFSGRVIELVMKAPETTPVMDTAESVIVDGAPFDAEAAAAGQADPDSIPF